GEIFYWYDLKTIGSIVLLVIYSFYLILRQDRKLTNKSKSIYSSATFLVLLVNFFLFSVLSNFHFYQIGVFSVLEIIVGSRRSKLAEIQPNGVVDQSNDKPLA